MRGIKFRVMRKEDDGWRMYAPSSIIDLWNGGNGSYNVMQKELTHYENEELVFLQYTGLKDSNGVEIYEGDILNILSTKKPMAFVIYGFNGFCYKWIDKVFITVRQTTHEPIFHNVNLHEIIGNIYQNPELLNTK